MRVVPFFGMRLMFILFCNFSAVRVWSRQDRRSRPGLSRRDNLFRLSIIRACGGRARCGISEVSSAQDLPLAVADCSDFELATIFSARLRSGASSLRQMSPIYRAQRIHRPHQALLPLGYCWARCLRDPGGRIRDSFVSTCAMAASHDISIASHVMK